MRNKQSVFLALFIGTLAAISLGTFHDARAAAPIGLGLASGLTFLGGGDVRYTPEMGNTEIQQSDDDTDEASAKGTTGIALQETAENNKACADARKNTCSDHDAQPAR